MKKLFLLLLIILCLIGCTPKHVPTLPISEGSEFEVHFIDVGQADSALILCDGKAMLIDGGNVADSSLIYSYLKKYSVDSLDYMIATHPHEDHIGGLSGALNYASVETVYTSTIDYPSETFEIFFKQAQKNGAEILVPEVGETFKLGSAEVEIVGCNSVEETNNSSIVLRIVYGETAFLFTADAERDAEQVILKSGAELKSTVLKVGHHGSYAATSYPFLREVMPEYAVISVGEGNMYGHPHDEALSRLRDADVTVYRTDELGTVICRSDGVDVEFSFEKNLVKQDGTENSDYVLNTSSKKIHLPACESVKDMSDKNREYYSGTKEELLLQGYSICKSCRP